LSSVKGSVPAMWFSSVEATPPSQLVAAFPDPVPTVQPQPMTR